MNFRFKKSVLIKNRIFMTMLTVTLFQAITFLLIISIMGVFSELNTESYRIVNEQNVTRAQEFSTNLESISMNTIVAVNNFHSELNKLLEIENVQADKIHLNDDAFYKTNVLALETIKNLTNRYYVTGAFFVFNGSNFDKESTSRHSAIYVRDISPKIVGQQNNDLMIEKGPQQIMKDYQIVMSAFWDVDYDFSKTVPNSSYDFYLKPYEAALQEPERRLDQLGYWSMPFIMFGDGQYVMTYSVPIITSEGEVCGVFGIELLLSSLPKNYLPYRELPYANSFYVLGEVENDTLRTDWIINSGPLAARYFTWETEDLKLDEVQGTDLVKKVIFDKIDNPNLQKSMLCVVSPVSTYVENSYYDNENWSLLAFMPQQELLSVSNNVLIIFAVSTIINLITGIVLSKIASRWATKDIERMPQIISNVDANKPMKFDKTNIIEIDELTSAIEVLNKNVLESSKRISKIMEMTSMPIGCYEYKKNRDVVFVTSSMNKLLGIPLAMNENTNYIPKTEWNWIYSQISADYDNKYKMYRWQNGPDAPVKWLKIESSISGDISVGIIIDVTDEIQRRQKLERELDYDTLTSLYNIRSFKRRVKDIIDARPNETGIMLYGDLDDLKYINDKYGHDVGDSFIIDASQMFKLLEALGGVVSRISGDEFVAYIHGYENSTKANDSVFNFINENFNKTFLTPDKYMQRIRISIGASRYPVDSEDINELIKFADFAMYEVKKNIKGTVMEFRRETYSQKSFILEKREALNKLIDEKLVKFVFQPIVDVKTGKVYAYEALMRSQLEEFKSPYEILAVASAQSKLHQIEQLTLFGTCDWLYNHLDEIGDSKLFINTIPNQILNIEDSDKLLVDYPGIYEKIVFEITENEDGTNQMDDKVRIIRELFKSKVAIDDFGSGYSNELRILTINPDYIKIDMGLIRNIDTDRNKQKIVSNIISYCQPRGIVILAEGVETEEELRKIVELNVDLVQGYYFAKPSEDIVPIEKEKINLLLSMLQ